MKCTLDGCEQAHCKHCGCCTLGANECETCLDFIHRYQVEFMGKPERESSPAVRGIEQLYRAAEARRDGKPSERIRRKYANQEKANLKGN